ncbi:hypothetical protein TGMAS_249215 [Toxoplasma gondii MAS]|uniref:Uncharacterized protein n=2 Tax=Toxoplasma gondii TaxID=5811 RepID=A0A086QDJ8_TOXGO|nr:hypothetical protein TGMAS_249215 [Toxoplasma gondii MAS]PUA90775.1 hypothetical protein TGBR9_249215 [Toxoplasma gondii TgCATBr9]
MWLIGRVVPRSFNGFPANGGDKYLGGASVAMQSPSACGHLRQFRVCSFPIRSSIPRSRRQRLQETANSVGKTHRADSRKEGNRERQWMQDSSAPVVRERRTETTAHVVFQRPRRDTEKRSDATQARERRRRGAPKKRAYFERGEQGEELREISMAFRVPDTHQKTALSRHVSGLRSPWWSFTDRLFVGKRFYQSDRQRAAAEAQLEKREAAVYAPRSFGQLYEPRSARSKKVHRQWVKEVPFYLQPAVAERNALIKSQRALSADSFRSRYSQNASSLTTQNSEMPPQLAKIFERSRDQEASSREEILFTLLRLLSSVRLRQKAAKQRSERAREGLAQVSEGEEVKGENPARTGEAVAIPGLDKENLSALDQRIMEYIDSWTVSDIGLLLVTRRELRDCLSRSRTRGRDHSTDFDEGDEKLTRALLRRLVFQRGQPFSQYASLYALQALLHLSQSRQLRSTHAALKTRRGEGAGVAASDGFGGREEGKEEGHPATEGLGKTAGVRGRGQDQNRLRDVNAFEDADMVNMIVKRVGRNMASCDLEILARIVNVLSSLPLPPKEITRKSRQEGEDSQHSSPPWSSPAESQDGTTVQPAAEQEEDPACAMSTVKRKMKDPDKEGNPFVNGVASVDKKMDPEAERSARPTTLATLCNSYQRVAPAGSEGSERNGHPGAGERGNLETVSGINTEKTQASYLADRNGFLYAVATHIFTTAFTDSEQRSASELANTFASALPSSPCPAADPPSPAQNSKGTCSTPAASASAASRQKALSSLTTPLWASPSSRGSRAAPGDRSWTYSRLCILLAGLSRTGVIYPPLFYALKPMVVALRLQFPPPMLAALLVSYAHLGPADETGFVDLFGTLGRELVKGVRGMDVAVVGVAANAFANAGVLHQEWFAVVAETFPSRMPLCSPRLLGMIANAYVRLGLVDDPLLPSLFHCARQRLPECDWHTLALLFQASTKIGSTYSGFSREAADSVCHALEQEAPRHPVKSEARKFLLSFKNNPSKCAPSVFPSRSKLSSSSESIGNELEVNVTRNEEHSLARQRCDNVGGPSSDLSAMELSDRQFSIRGELASTSAFILCYALAKAKGLLSSTPSLRKGASGREGEIQQCEKEEIWQLLLATELTQVVTRFVPSCRSFAEVANTSSAVARFIELREEMLSREGREQDSLQRETKVCGEMVGNDEKNNTSNEAWKSSTVACAADTPRDRPEGCADPSVIRKKLTNYLISACEAYFQAVEDHLSSFRTLKNASLGPPELHKLICAFHALHRAKGVSRATPRRMVVLERMMCDNSDLFHEMTLLPLRQMAAAVSYLGMDNDDIIQTFVMLQQKRKKKKVAGVLAAPALSG